MKTHHPYFSALTPKVVDFFSAEDEDLIFKDIQVHIEEVRRLFEWPGIPYHDEAEEAHSKFNRWCWHNLPVLTAMHHGDMMRDKVMDLVEMDMKPSYNFLSMYGDDGVCPPHTDRPQCMLTIDVCVDQDATWPIYIKSDGAFKSYTLTPGQALIYSGTYQEHYRKPMQEDSTATFCNMAFFHFVTEDFMGALS